MEIFSGIVIGIGVAYLIGHVIWALVDTIQSRKRRIRKMHLDPISGMWKNDDNDYQPQLVTDEPTTDDLDETPTENNRLANENTPSKLNGKCILSILFENAGEYIKWQKYFGERKWDFIQSYPAIFRAEYSFHNSIGVEILAKKIVQLLEAGFNVRAANWELKKEEEIRK